jgi:hypothetical protein
LGLILKLDKGEPTRPTTFTIGGEIDIRRRGDSREMFSNLGFGRLIRKVPNKQSNRHCSSPIGYFPTRVASLRGTLNPDSIIEPLYRRRRVVDALWSD